MVEDGVSALSVLAAEGGPNFDGPTLALSPGVERADATRLSEAFRPPRLRTKSIIDWIAALLWSRTEKIVRGADQDRVALMFRALHRRLVKGRTQREG